MAVLDFLFEGSPPPTISSSVTTQNSLPDWYQEYVRGLLGRSNAVAAAPYEPYPAARVAPLTSDTTDAFSSIRQNQGMWQPALGQAQSLTQGVGQGFDRAEFNEYMSPYQDDVASRIAVLGARNLSENLLPQVNDTFIGNGQPFSSRHEEFTNRAVRDANESILGAQSQLLNQGYKDAMSGYQTGEQLKLGAGQQLSALGSAQQSAMLKDAAALEAAGQTQRGVDQQSLDVARQQFEEQRDWPRLMASFMNQQVRGLPATTSSTQTTTGPGSNFQPSPLAQLASASSAAGAGMYAYNNLFK